MILITGITGLTGRYLLDIVTENNLTKEILCTVRENSDVALLQEKGVKYVNADVNDVNSLRKVASDDHISMVIHLVNIRSAPNILTIASEYNIKRVIIISTTGIYSRFNQYSAIYKELEVKIIKSNLDYTIIRPTMIYGNHRDKNIHKLVKLANRLPVFPIIGSGKNLFQPIYARDLAYVVFQSMMSNISIKKIYDVSGKDPIEYKEMIRLIYHNLGKPFRTFTVPFVFASIVGYVANYIPWTFLDKEKIDRLKEDKNYGHDLAKKELGFQPISFEEGIVYEIEALKKAGVI